MSTKRPFEYPEVMTITQVAGFLKQNEATLSEWIKLRGLPVHDLDSEMRFIKKEILAWLRSNPAE